MESVFNKCLGELKESNTIWKESVRLRDLSDIERKKSAEIIKNVYSKFHERIIELVGIQGNVKMIFNKDNSEIIGISAEWNDMTGQAFKRDFFINNEGATHGSEKDESVDQGEDIPAQPNEEDGE